MKRQKLFVTLVLTLCMLVVATAVVTLSITANEQGLTGGGKWADVCCGPQCGGVDYCTGTGTYKCCK